MHDSKTVQRSALCRSRRELSNEYLLAKIGFDTAEITRPSKLGGKFNSILTSLLSVDDALGVDDVPEALRHLPPADAEQVVRVDVRGDGQLERAQ